jgi:metal-responsive CopG/Arc/MetJ family transcriptional regulator
MKVIQLPMDESLLRAVNRKAKSLRSTRAAFIRAACQEYLRRIENQELERRYIEGYRRTPEVAALGTVGAKLASEVLPIEDWE